MEFGRFTKSSVRFLRTYIRIYLNHNINAYNILYSIRIGKAFKSARFKIRPFGRSERIATNDTYMEKRIVHVFQDDLRV